MAHTIKIIAGGLALLAICVLTGRLTGSADDSARIARAALGFIPLWFVGAGLNMWFGVARAGYTVREELPFFFLVFLLPVGIALVIWWRYAHV